MNIRKLIDSITENWAAKVVCLILAFLFYVFNKTSTLQEKTFTIPLKVEAEGIMMPAVDLPKYIKVVVTTTKDNMAQVKESDFSAKVNLNNFVEAGEYLVPVVVSVRDDLEHLDTFECRSRTEYVNVLLDEKILKYIPVEVAASGNPAYGYCISEFDVSPATVKVVGPSRIVEKTKKIYTRKVIVDGAATSFSQDVKLDNLNSKLNVMPESDFKVTVMISPSEESRTYEKIIPVVRSLNAELEISGSIPYVDLQASGTTLLLDTFNPSEGNVYIDFAGITEAGEYEIPVNITLPSGIVLTEKSSDSVIVKLIRKDTAVSAEPLDLDKLDEVTEKTSDKNSEEVLEVKTE